MEYEDYKSGDLIEFITNCTNAHKPGDICPIVFAGYDNGEFKVMTKEVLEQYPLKEAWIAKGSIKANILIISQEQLKEIEEIFNDI